MRRRNDTISEIVALLEPRPAGRVWLVGKQEVGPRRAFEEIAPFYCSPDERGNDLNLVLLSLPTVAMVLTQTPPKAGLPLLIAETTVVECVSPRLTASLRETGSRERLSWTGNWLLNYDYFDRAGRVAVGRSERRR